MDTCLLTKILKLNFLSRPHSPQLFFCYWSIGGIVSFRRLLALTPTNTLTIEQQRILQSFKSQSTFNQKHFKSNEPTLLTKNTKANILGHKDQSIYCLSFSLKISTMSKYVEIGSRHWKLKPNFIYFYSNKLRKYEGKPHRRPAK